MSIKIKFTALFLLYMFGMHALLAQTSISGNVSSSDIEGGLPGVTIRIKGTTKGATTNLEGYYSLEVAEGEILSFSYVGYISQERQVGASSKINIVLEPDVAALEEIIVMGYSTKTKKELAASVVSLDSKALKGVTAPDVGSLLQGKVAGLSVTASSGAPGAAPDLRLRGITSINIDRNPLIVVDGMMGGNFVPSNVETITVLKDAAAIGLYGSQGAAGVIIVTTKKATSDVPEYTFSAKLVRKEITTGNFEMMGAQELYDTQEIMWGDDKVGFLKLRPEDLADQNFDWLGEAFNPGWLQNYNFGVYGRSKSINYAFDVDYFDEEGTFKNTDYQRLNLHAAVGLNGAGRFSINSDINAQFSQNKENHYSWFEDAFWSMPWDNPYAENGDPIFLNGPDYNATETPWIGQFRRNPFNSMRYNNLGGGGDNLIWSTRMVFELSSWLNLETRTRLSSSHSNYDRYYSVFSHEGITNSGEVYKRTSSSIGVLSTHMLRFSKDFGNHSLSGFLAHEGGDNDSDFLESEGWSIAPGLEVISGAADPKQIKGYTDPGRGISFIAEVSHSFSEKYFTTLVYRVDGNSKFADDKKYGHFPAASFAWLLSEEGFLQGASFIDLLKFRTSYGLVGNDGGSALSNSAYLGTYGLGGQYNGLPAAFPDNLENPDLAWETTTMLNIGLDLAILNNDMAISVDVYNKNVDDMIFDRFLAPSTGFEVRTENIGSMNNKGIELALNYDKTIGDFTYSGSLTMSYNKNEITRITEISDEQVITTGPIQQILKVGESAFSWYMPKWLGVDPATGAPQWEQIITDDNGNEIDRVTTSVYNDATDQVISSALPSVNAGLSNTIGYKGMSLSVLLTYQGGNAIYNRTREFVDHDGANTGINFMRLQDGWSRWEKPGDIATHPVLERGDSDNSHATSSRYIEDGDYLRIRNITLSYRLPFALVSKLGLKGVSISIGADNLFTFTSFSGMDPDIDIRYSEFTLPGTSYLKYPISKQFVAGINIKF